MRPYDPDLERCPRCDSEQVTYDETTDGEDIWNTCPDCGWRSDVDDPTTT